MIDYEVKHKVGDLVRFCDDFDDEKVWCEEGQGKFIMAMVSEVYEEYDTIELDFLYENTGWFECGEAWEHWMFEKIQ